MLPEAGRTSTATGMRSASPTAHFELRGQIETLEREVERSGRRWRRAEETTADGRGFRRR